jgi:hypothetical protein
MSIKKVKRSEGNIPTLQNNTKQLINIFDFIKNRVI